MPPPTTQASSGENDQGTLWSGLSFLSSFFTGSPGPAASVASDAPTNASEPVAKAEFSNENQARVRFEVVGPDLKDYDKYALQVYGPAGHLEERYLLERQEYQEARFCQFQFARLVREPDIPKEDWRATVLASWPTNLGKQLDVLKLEKEQEVMKEVEAFIAGWAKERDSPYYRDCPKITAIT
ncbi:hypothetical protein QFC20_002628 [Naganishia adeliensis]|uniref:Uncharacterized protein n=1 Tax=Naganishia adeliensis TaxID=92952 RepID=A0ACC2WI69_9TREE|nr:hypothetical protein QFC20_002628 [Naganishia adeliensis]